MIYLRISVAIILLACLPAACGPGNLSLDGLREEIIGPNVKYFYYEQNEQIKTTAVKSRTIRRDENHYLFQYCSVNDALPFCGEITLSTDTSERLARERTESQEGDRKTTRTTTWTFAARRAYTAREETFTVFRYDSEQMLLGCNSMYWCPALGVIHWKNFINTLMRRTEFANEPEKNKLVELLLVHIRQDQGFYENCTFVHRSVLN